MTPPALAAALAYAEKFGWPVFPTQLVRQANGTLDKIPLVKCKNITTPDPAQIEAWWRRRPDAVPSTPTGKRSGIIILDIDCKDGRWGFDTLDALGKSILPDTPIAHTPSGGVHVYFSCIELEIRNSAGAKGLGLGLDIRGEGGAIVLPSPNSGYWWDPHKNLDTVSLRPAPDWLGYRPPKTSRAGEGRKSARVRSRSDSRRSLREYPRMRCRSSARRSEPRSLLDRRLGCCRCSEREPSPPSPLRCGRVNGSPHRWRSRQGRA